MAKPHQRFELHIDPNLLNRIQQRAQQLGLSNSSFLRLAACRYLELDRGGTFSTPPPDTGGHDLPSTPPS